MSTKRHRLARIRLAIDAAPVRRCILREAYGWFTGFGELPDDDHVAYEVVRQALRGGEEAALDDEARLARRVTTARLAYQQRERPSDSWPPSVRALLFDEALFEPEPLRALARAQIAVEVTYGGDVESPAFAARYGIPMYGSIAMHMAGWPGRLAVPPYEAQAKRLFVRLDLLRARIPHDDPSWFEDQAKAIVRFRQAGELPSDDLHVEAMLVNVELDLLGAHKRGKDVAEAMALLDQVQRLDGEVQAAALQRLCGMARAGLLP